MRGQLNAEQDPALRCKPEHLPERSDRAVAVSGVASRVVIRGVNGPLVVSDSRIEPGVVNCQFVTALRRVPVPDPDVIHTGNLHGPRHEPGLPVADVRVA